MRIRSTGMCLGCLVLLNLLSSCSSSPPPPAVCLPVHPLDLSGDKLASRDNRQAMSRQMDDLGVASYRHWRYIVIHHSASDAGSAAAFDALHRAKGWDELGYHFVIDNGNGGQDGRIEVGARWINQKWGAHTGGTPNNEYNNFGIGICLVGNFNSSMPSREQLASLRRLVLCLMQRFDIPPENVIGHRDAPLAKTQCPGAMFHNYLMGAMRLELAKQVAMK